MSLALDVPAFCEDTKVKAPEAPVSRQYNRPDPTVA
jgi:hypothetical protein